MNHHLLREWTRRVHADDTIICLGDVAHLDAWRDRRLVSCLSSSMQNSSPFRTAETPLITHQGADRIVSCVSGTAH